MTGYQSKRAAAQGKLAQPAPVEPNASELFREAFEEWAKSRPHYMDTPSARAYLAKVLDDDDTQVYAADTAIVQTLLPKLYSIIDRLLDGKDKALVIEARRVLPKAYKNSFEKGKGV